MPKISVIIPTIGRETLPRAIESILNQTFQDFEIIVTDDTEDEKARPLVEPYLKDQRIRYVVNRKYMHGPCGNKNNGLDNVKGEYFTILDDDDYIFPNALEELLNIAEAYGYKSVFANCQDDTKGSFTGKHYEKSEEVDWIDFLCGRYEGDYFGILHSSLVKGKRFKDECWGGENILWWSACKEAGKMFYLHKVLKKYTTLRADRVTVKTIDSQFAFRTFLVYKYILEIYSQDFKMYCPKNFFRYALRGVYFANLGGVKREILGIVKQSFLISKKLTLLLIPWAVICIIFPNKFVRFLYEDIIKKLNFHTKVKTFLLKK